MVIDKIGGISPGYNSRKPEPTSKPEKTVRASDNVSISQEASRTADAARITKMASGSNDVDRAEKLKQVKQKLENGDYDNLSDDVLSSLADNVLNSFVSRS